MITLQQILRIMGYSFIDRFWSQYPIPRAVSVFGGDGLTTVPLADLGVLVAACVEDLKSDLYVTDYVDMYSQVTQVGDDVFAVVNARLSAVSFMGNTSVKVQFDRSRHQLRCLYVPARATVRRYMHVEDIDSLVGSKLQYFTAYVNFKAALKELNILQSVSLEADNGSVNLQVIADFAERNRQQYESMREDIFIYTGGF